jgi:hypothetical protein
LRDLPQQKNPKALWLGSSLNFICSHVPMEIFIFYELRKQGGNERLGHKRLCPENKALHLMFYYELKYIG